LFARQPAPLQVTSHPSGDSRGIMQHPPPLFVLSSMSNNRVLRMFYPLPNSRTKAVTFVMKMSAARAVRLRRCDVTSESSENFQ
jgi:hypothetical protein